MNSATKRFPWKNHCGSSQSKPGIAKLFLSSTPYGSP
ncbi:hypothetical protein T08_9671 [Trichinella sp. T8]|nr:hypothetical protein T08_9671 [Trichinella sp. T8]